MSLAVSYGPRRIKVPCTASSPLAQIRDNACKAFGLDAAKYGLAHNGKNIDLTVPFRFSNLVANANVSLVPAATAGGTIRVKVRVPGKSDFTGTFEASTDVKDVAIAAGVHDLQLGNQTVSGALGGICSGSVVLLGLTAPPKAPSATPQAPPPAQAPQTQPPQAEVPETKAQETGNEVSVAELSRPEELEELNAPSGENFRSAQVIVTSGARPSADTPQEMSETQFRVYYNYLRRSSGARTMLSQSTRDKLARERRAKIGAIVVRIRMPDNSLLQGVFGSHETGATVEDFVRGHLRHADHEFRLVTSDTAVHVTGDKLLVEDYRLGSRAMLLLRFVGESPSGPVLSDKVLATVPAPEDKAAPPAEPSPASTETKPTEPTGTLKKTPKWLKLHK